MYTPLPDGTELFHKTYRIVQGLGNGGFGITYRALDLSLKREVAIKEWFPMHCNRIGNNLQADGRFWTPDTLAKFKARAREEGQILARLNHNHIVKIYSLFTENETVYFVMEFVQGSTLEAYLQDSGGRLPVAEAVGIIESVGRALEVVHAAQLLHRDIKPANMMRRTNGEIVLIDFGASREFVPGQAMSHTSIKSEGFAPPEQYERHGLWGPPLDIYSLSATLYVLLTGEELTQESRMRQYRDTVQPVCAIRNEISVSLGTFVVERGMAIEPAQRPQTMGAFLSELESAASTQGGIRVNRIDNAELVWITPGPFKMGDDDDAIWDYNLKVRNNPRHVVDISGYWMYKNLVTVGQYKRFCQATGHAMPPEPGGFDAEWQSKKYPIPRFNPGWSQEDHPVVNVTWDDARAYAKWAGGDLPTEAQWEKAARGTDGLQYPWGNDWDVTKLWCSRKEVCDAGGTHRVGELGISPFGCTDMAGNVWQWCKDWYDADYWKTAHGKDPENTGTARQTYRVVRGGSWNNGSPVIFRAAFRDDYFNPSDWYGYLGFRCVVRADSL